MAQIQEKTSHQRAIDESKNEKGKSSLASFWLEEIKSAKGRNRAWRKRGEKIVDIYRSDKKNEIFNILYANTETLRPIMYMQPPTPEVQRRFLDADPVARASCKILERCLTSVMDNEANSFDDAADRIVLDFLLPGRGVMVSRYNAETIEYKDAETDETKTEKVFEELYVQYIHWRNFLHSDNRSWQEVWWAGFGFDLTKEDLIEQFGEEIADKIPLAGEFDWESTSEDGYTNKKEGFAKVWEIWDKRTKKVIFVSEGYDEIIKESDVPYHLDGFFPTPPPLDSIFTTDNLIPVPEYLQYQNQAEELNILTRRLYRLIDALRVKVAYDSSFSELESIFKSEELEAIPISNFQRFSSQGGFRGIMDSLPLNEIADVISKIIALRTDTINQIYEITGLSDILRGSTDPRETATAQRFKTQYGGMRVQKRQRRVQKYFRSMLRILGEIMAEHFEPETLLIMSNFPDSEIDKFVEIGIDQIMMLLRNEKMRGFKINIETDSMIAIDEISRKQDVVEFMSAVGNLMTSMQASVQNGIFPPEVAKAVMLFAARRFNTGRDLEAALDQIGSQKPQEKQDPAVQIQQMKQQLEIAKLKQQQESERAKFTIEMRKLMLEARKIDVDKKLGEGKMMVDLIEADINRHTAFINAQGGNI